MPRSKRKSDITAPQSPTKREKCNSPPIIISDDSEDDIFTSAPRRSLRRTTSSASRSSRDHRAYRLTRGSSRLENDFLSTCNEVTSPTPAPRIEASRQRRANSKDTEDRLTCLPFEIHELICANFTRHEDIISYMVLNKQVKHSISNLVWRQLFLIHFDPLEHVQFQTLSDRCFAKYKIRSWCSKDNIVMYFTQQETPIKWQSQYASMIRDLVFEANGRREIECGKTTTKSLNMSFLQSIMFPTAKEIDSAEGSGQAKARCDLIEAVGQLNGFSAQGFLLKSKDSLPFALQLTLTHLAWRRKPMSMRAVDLYEAQDIVYKDENRMPLFKGTTINVKYFLGIVRFWRYHLTHENGRDSSEELLSHEYLYNDNIAEPRMWSGRILDERLSLGIKWTGCYTSMDNNADLVTIRSGNSRRRQHISDNVSENFFESMTLFWDVEHIDRMQDLLQRADRYIEGRWIDAPSSSEAGELPIPYKRFFGIGQDGGTKYWLVGTIHAVANLSSVPGWKRISFVKCLPYQDWNATYWAYEGICIPGGEIMMGRWWNPVAPPLADGGRYSGCWAFWNNDNLDDNPNNSLADIETANAFLRGMDDPIPF